MSGSVEDDDDEVTWRVERAGRGKKCGKKGAGRRAKNTVRIKEQSGGCKNSRERKEETHTDKRKTEDKI